MRQNTRHVLAVDLGGTKVAAAVVSAEGKILVRLMESVDTASPSGPVRQILRLARELAQGQEPSRSFVAGAVAVPGLVRQTDTVWAPNLPGWERMPLRTRLESALKIPFVIESDRNAAVLGESWMGAARGKRDVVALIIGTGIGAGILAGGEILRGAHELSGCAGWMVVSDRCTEQAVHVGHLESLTAGPGIARTAAAAANGNRGIFASDDGKITAKQVADAARKGDTDAMRIFEDAGRMLGRAVANIVSLFDPEMIVLGGGMAATSDLILPTLRTSMLEWAQPLSARRVKVAVSKLGGDANLLGAAHLAWKSAKSKYTRTTNFKKGHRL